MKIPLGARPRVTARLAELGVRGWRPVRVGPHRMWQAVDVKGRPMPGTIDGSGFPAAAPRTVTTADVRNVIRMLRGAHYNNTLDVRAATALGWEEEVFSQNNLLEVLRTAISIIVGGARWGMLLRAGRAQDAASRAIEALTCGLVRIEEGGVIQVQANCWKRLAEGEVNIAELISQADEWWEYFFNRMFTAAIAREEAETAAREEAPPQRVPLAAAAVVREPAGVDRELIMAQLEAAGLIGGEFTATTLDERQRRQVFTEAVGQGRGWDKQKIVGHRENPSSDIRVAIPEVTEQLGKAITVIIPRVSQTVHQGSRARVKITGTREGKVIVEFIGWVRDEKAERKPRAASTATGIPGGRSEGQIRRELVLLVDAIVAERGLITRKLAEKVVEQMMRYADLLEWLAQGNMSGNGLEATIMFLAKKAKAPKSNPAAALPMVEGLLRDPGNRRVVAKKFGVKFDVWREKGGKEND